MEEVEELMEPVACMLPYIAKKVCPPPPRGNGGAPTGSLSGVEIGWIVSER